MNFRNVVISLSYVLSTEKAYYSPFSNRETEDIDFCDSFETKEEAELFIKNNNLNDINKNYCRVEKVIFISKDGKTLDSFLPVESEKADESLYFMILEQLER